MNIKKLSATLLATTLAAAFALAPVTEVKAYQEPDYWDAYEGNDVIDVSTTKVTIEGVGTGADWDEAYLNAYNDFVNKAKANGIIEDGDKNNYEFVIPVKQGEKLVNKYYKYVNQGWDLEFRGYEDSETADLKTYKFTGTFTYTEYKNSITGETSFDRDALKGKGYTLTEKVNDYPEKVKVYTGGVAYIKVNLGSGNIKLKKVKSSNKKVIKAKIVETDEVVTTEKYNFSKDSKGYYYKSNVTDDKIYVSSPTEVVNKSNATVYIKVYGVKDGKATVSFDIYDINGTKTGKGKVTVYSDKNLPITDITYGGQSLEQGVKIGEANKNYMYQGKDLNTFYEYTTKKSGQLKVKTSKDYDIKRIQVGKLEKFKWNNTQYPDYNQFNYSTGDRTATNLMDIETSRRHPVDLNGDGDYEDIVNGMDESKVYFRYKTIKNGKKIKLSKIPDYTKGSTNASIRYANNADQSSSYSYTFNDKKDANTAPTAVRVTLYNKVTKEYEIYTYIIYLKIKKY